MAIIKKVSHWIANRLKDIFYDATSEHLDNGRSIAVLSLLMVIGSALWNMHMKQAINLSDLGTGLGTILTALVVYVYHDRKQNASQ